MADAFAKFFTYRKRHPGTSRAGNLAFYAVIAVAAVALVGLFGIYVLAHETLQGVAAIVPPS
jgi:hypothetical protein